MATVDKSLLSKVARKNDDGTLGTMQNIGTTSDNIIDPTYKIPLSALVKNYMDFMYNNKVIYVGATQPDIKSNVAIWIDTEGTTRKG